MDELDLLNELLDGNKKTEGTETPPEGDKGTGDNGGDPNNLPPQGDEGTQGTPPEGDEAAAEAEAEAAKKAAAEESSKQNAAFAKMRTENSNMQKLVKNLGEALGLDASKPDELATKLEQLADVRRAKNNNLTPEELKEREHTRARIKELEQENHKRVLIEQLAGISSTYQVDEAGLRDFVIKLNEEGVDVEGNHNINLEYEYFKRYGSTYVEKRVQVAVEEALKKQKAAADSSSTPPAGNGKPPGDGEVKVSTVAGLDALLAGANKK